VALAPLAPFVAALFALGLAVLLTVLVIALINFLSKIPFGVGSWLADKAQALEQTISHALGTAFHDIDHLIGSMLHTLARFMDTLWNVIAATPHALLHVAETLVPIAAAVHAIREIAHGAHVLAHTIAHRFVIIGRELYHLGHRVKALEHEIAKGIGHDLRIYIKALEQKVDHVINGTIPAIRSEVATADDAIANLYEWAKGKASLVGVGTFAMAVAAAIGLEIWNLLRCPFAKDVANNRGCSLWSALDDLLGLVALGIAAAEFETLVHEAQNLTNDAVTVFDDVFGLQR